MRTFTLAVAALLIPVCLIAAEETFSGVVLSPDGQAAAGVTLLAQKRLPDTSQTTVKLTADATGRFEFMSVPFRGEESLPVLAIKPGVAIAVGEASIQTPQPIRLPLNAAARGGVVVLPSGKPAAGASVELIEVSVPTKQSPASPTTFSLKEEPLRAVTDETGAFSFPGFEPRLAALVRIAAPGHCVVTTRLTDAKQQTVSLCPEATISGKVLVNGKPRWGGSSVSYLYQSPRLTDAFGSTRTGADGVYTLRGLVPGSIQVRAWPPEGMAPLPPKVFTLTAGQSVTHADFTFTPGAIVRGKVTNAVGESLKGISVTAVQGDRSLTHAETGTDGKYELRVPPGTYQLQFQATYVGPPQTMIDPVACKESDVVEGKDFALQTLRQVAIQAFLPDGRPAAGAKAWGSGIPDLIADAQGCFRLLLPLEPKPTSDRTVLLITHTDGSAAKLLSFLSVGDIPNRLTVDLRSAAEATVRIVDERQQPVAGHGFLVGYPTLYDDSRTGITTRAVLTSDEQGFVRFTCLPPEESISLRPNFSDDFVVDPQWPQGLFSFAPGERREFPTIVVNPAGRSLQVFVGDAEGKPVPNAQVIFGWPPPGFTDGEGKVTLTKLPLRGKVVLFAVHPDKELYALEIVEPAGDLMPALLLKPLGEATGVLVAEPHGKPLPGYIVLLKADLPSGMRWLEDGLRRRLHLDDSFHEFTSDANGRWRADRLLPGVQYSVFARPKGEGWKLEACLTGTFVASGETGQQVELSKVDLDDEE